MWYNILSMGKALDLVRLQRLNAVSGTCADHILFKENYPAATGGFTDIWQIPGEWNLTVSSARLYAR